jgi:all-trans-retinol dehydrogenase (NAD+)
LSTVFNTLFLVFEIFVLIVKFWIAVFQGLYETITAEERSVNGDVVLITGAGQGIGRELALQYSALGATIVCWDVNEQMNLDTVNLIKSKGKQAFGYT